MGRAGVCVCVCRLMQSSFSSLCPPPVGGSKFSPSFSPPSLFKNLSGGGWVGWDGDGVGCGCGCGGGMLVHFLQVGR